MSINRAVVALGAVAVVGVATLGFSIPFAVHAGKPVPNVAVTVGSTWTQMAPADKSCYNGGKALTAKQNAACSAAVQKLLSDPSKLKTITIPSTNATFAINVDQIVADKGWLAGTLNGQLVPPTKDAYAGPLPVTQVLSTTSQTTGATTLNSSGPVIVEMGDGKSASSAVYGEWLFQLKVKGS